MRPHVTLPAIAIAIACALFLSGEAVAQVAATKAVAINPTTLQIVPEQSEFFRASSNELHLAIGVSNIPVALNRRTLWVETLADMQAIITTNIPDRSMVIVGCRSVAGDAGGGPFEWRASSTSTEDDGTVFEGPGATGRWHRIITGPYDPRWWGSRGDASHDDTAAFQACIDATPSRGAMFIPYGEHILTAPLVLRTFLTMQGQGPGSMLSVNHSGSALTGVSGSRIYTLRLDNFAINTATGAVADKAIDLSYISHAVISRLFIHLWKGLGFRVAFFSEPNSALSEGGYFHRITGCEVYTRGGANTYGVYGAGGPADTYGPNSWLILGNYFNAEAQSGAGGQTAIYLSNCNGATVIGNGGEGGWTNGVVLAEDSSACTVLANRIEIVGGVSSDRRGLTLGGTGHFAAGDMLEGLGGEGSLTRISPEVSQATFLEPSWGGYQEIWPGLLVGRSKTRAVRNYAPLDLESEVAVVSTNSSTNIAFRLAIIDGSGNVRASWILNTNRSEIRSGGSASALPMYFTSGLGTYATMRQDRASFLGEPAAGNALTIHGDLLLGPNPTNLFNQGYGNPSKGAFIRSTDPADRVGVNIGLMDGGANNRLQMEVDGPGNRAVIRVTYSNGDAPLEMEAGNAVLLRLTGDRALFPTNVVAARGIGLNVSNTVRVVTYNEGGTNRVGIVWPSGITNAIASQN